MCKNRACKRESKGRFNLISVVIGFLLTKKSNIKKKVDISIKEHRKGFLKTLKNLNVIAALLIFLYMFSLVLMYFIKIDKNFFLFIIQQFKPVSVFKR